MISPLILEFRRKRCVIFFVEKSAFKIRTALNEDICIICYDQNNLTSFNCDYCQKNIIDNKWLICNDCKDTIITPTDI